MRRASQTVTLGLVFGVVAAACGGDDLGDCRDTASCPKSDASATGGAGGTSGRGGSAGGGAGGTMGSGGSSGSGGTTGGTSGAGPDTGCDLSKALSEDLCAIDEAYGIFVSAQTGSDSPDGGTAQRGSRQAPYKTIALGMAAAKATGKRVYVCADGGDYPESLRVDAALDGLEVYGGFRCATWEYPSTSALKAAVVSPQPIGLSVTGLSMGLRLEDVAITAANATTDGGSSFGTIVANSRNVVLRRVHVVAGLGKAGAAGGNGTQGTEGDPPGAGQNGKPASCAGDAGASQLGGVWPSASTCGSRGGAGGMALQDSDPDGGKGVFGSPRTNVTPGTVDNGGAGQTDTTVAAGGGVGSQGNTGPNGPAAQQAGTFSVTGFTPASGNAGTNGFPGQGGGGGGASKGNGSCVGASGGAGGMGGCGGIRGMAGGGGGASVALLSWMSSVTLDATALVAKDGGAGGKGGTGGDGGAGGLGGAVGNGTGQIGASGRGGDGGRGGPGGSGSGGTGGPSYAIVFQGTAPGKNNGTTTNFASGGMKGVGGQVPGGQKAADGVDGVADAEYQQP